jgi:hypothetical protein
MARIGRCGPGVERHGVLAAARDDGGSAAFDEVPSRAVLLI